MDKFLKDIKTNKTVCVFVSPHFDDAVFSAGGLMQKLIGQGTKVILVNVFTKAGSAHTMSAKAYLRQVGYGSATKLYKDREIEDQVVAKSLGIVPTNLGFVEALWRKKQVNIFTNRLASMVPELCSMYPTYRWHVAAGRLSLHDEKTVVRIQKRLVKYISKRKPVIFFAPMGIGGHVDHLAVKAAVSALGNKAYYWADYPYVLLSKKTTLGDKLIFRPDWVKKEKLIQGYVSQVGPVFGAAKIQRVSEEFYTA